jgi:DNA-binding MarR family transcriptional regulator
MTKSRQPAPLLPLIVTDVYELAGRFRDRGETIARRVGQTQARWQVMSVASGVPRTVPQVARRLGVSRQNVQRIADDLVRENWASFERNPDHSGSPFLVLRNRGLAALAEITRAAEAYHAEIAGKFSPGELKSVYRGLRRLLDATAESTQPEGDLR